MDRDAVAAARWLGLAAEQGERGAQVLLGRLYLEGEGVEQDLVRSVAWLRVASMGEAAEEMEAELLARAVRGLSEVDRQRAEALARELQARLPVLDER
jgi:hypothetical protein